MSGTARPTGHDQPGEFCPVCLSVEVATYLVILKGRGVDRDTLRWFVPFVPPEHWLLRMYLLRSAATEGLPIGTAKLLAEDLDLAGSWLAEKFGGERAGEILRLGLLHPSRVFRGHAHPRPAPEEVGEAVN